MLSSTIRKLKLKLLTKGIDAINPVIGAFLAQACAVSLDNQGHSSGVIPAILGLEKSFELNAI